MPDALEPMQDRISSRGKFLRRGWVDGEVYLVLILSCQALGSSGKEVPHIQVLLYIWSSCPQQATSKKLGKGGSYGTRDRIF
jgi:hypothetical protein